MGFAAFASPAYLARNGRPGRPVCSLAGHRLISTGTWAPGGDAWNAQLDEPASLALSVYPFSVARAASLAGLGIAVLPCLGSDNDPGLERVSEVISTMDMWVVTNPDVRNNPVVRAVKEHLIALLRAASTELSGADS
jgi:DNA-binding transcriptional LysR family regulator